MDKISDVLKWSMTIKNRPISDLVINDLYSLSIPLKPESYISFFQHFPHLPALIVNKNNHIIFGIDFYFHLKEKTNAVNVLQMDISDLDALVLNFNLKSKLLSINLLEKLLFIHKTLPLASADDLYQRTGLDIPINKNLRAKLPQLLVPEFEELLLSEGVSLKNALQLVEMEEKNRDLLIKLFLQIPFTHSQQKQIIELVEDILFRDKCSLAEVFARLNIEGKFKSEKAQEKILSALFRLRYPKYCQREEDWQIQLERWQLPAQVQVNHFPFFEKEEMQLSIKIKNLLELEKTLSTLKLIELIWFAAIFSPRNKLTSRVIIYYY